MASAFYLHRLLVSLHLQTAQAVAYNLMYAKPDDCNVSTASKHQTSEWLAAMKLTERQT